MPGGVFFMQLLNNLISGKALLRAVAAWIVCALLGLLLATGLLCWVNAGERTLGYVSSALSLLAAIGAGASAVKSCQKGRVLTALLSGMVISVLLLLLGFIISEGSLSPDAILSVIMFTLSGAMLGGFFSPENRKKGGKSKKHHVKRRVNVIA